MVTILALATLSTIGVAFVWFGTPRRALSDANANDRADSSNPTDLHRLGPATRYPTLAFIEQGLNSQPGTLTNALNAASLEAQARALVAEYWSDTAWTTGVVSRQAFDQVLTRLIQVMEPMPLSEISPFARSEFAETISAA